MKIMFIWDLIIRKVSEYFKTRWAIVKELLKYRHFILICRKEAKNFNDFNPSLQELIFGSLSISLESENNLKCSLLLLPLDNNYVNLYGKILRMRSYLIDLYAWIKIYEQKKGEKEQLNILANTLEDSLILFCDSIYSFKEALIYAVVTLSWINHKVNKQKVNWRFNERYTGLGVLQSEFNHIKEVKVIINKIDTINEKLNQEPLNFRHKHTHRIQQGIELYGGQSYKITSNENNLRVGFGIGERIKVEKIKNEGVEVYHGCIDLFYEFENYCINYLKVKDWLKSK